MTIFCFDKKNMNFLPSAELLTFLGSDQESTATVGCGERQSVTQFLELDGETGAIIALEIDNILVT